jgi:hypothetical protein
MLDRSSEEMQESMLTAEVKKVRLWFKASKGPIRIDGHLRYATLSQKIEGVMKE